MSKLLTFCFFFLSLSAVAQESVVINAPKLTARSQEVILVRSSLSPNKTEVTFPVQMQHRVCMQHDSRTVYRQSGLECGYDYHERRVPSGARYCIETRTDGQCLRWRQDHRIERVQVARSCYFQEVYCSRYGTETRVKYDDMTLAFKNLPALGGSESETFLVTARQKEYDSGSVKYEVKAISTLEAYQIKKKKTFLGIGNDDDWEVKR